MVNSTGWPGPHVAQLRLLVVRDEPDLVGHEHRQALARRDEGADRAGKFDHAAGLGGRDASVLQIEIGLIELGLRLLQRGAGAFKLRLEGLDAELWLRPTRRCSASCSPVAIVIGARLLFTLHSTRTLLDQILGARLFLLRELQLRLGLFDLCLGLH